MVLQSYPVWPGFLWVLIVRDVNVSLSNGKLADVIYGFNIIFRCLDDI